MVKSFKIVLVGNDRVGKTSLLIRTTTGAFPTDYIPTVFDNYQSNIIYKGHHFTVCYWDTAGSSDYDRLRPLCFLDTDMFIVCFDLNRPETLEDVKSKWIPEIRLHEPNTPFVLWGNKVDLVKNRKPAIFFLEEKPEKNTQKFTSRSKNLISSITSWLFTSKTPRNESETVFDDQLDIEQQSSNNHVHYSFTEVPSEILQHVLSFCSLEDVSRSCGISRRWYNIAASDEFWKFLLIREWSLFAHGSFSTAAQGSSTQEIESILAEQSQRTDHCPLKYPVRGFVFRWVSEATGGLKMAKALGAFAYVETSAKTGENLDSSWDAVYETFIRM